MQALLQNEKALRTLTVWISSGRFPHAVLIEGQNGSGRKTLAAQIAATILCEGENQPCFSCKHCIKVDKNIHPDFITYSGEGGARSFHIDKVRELRTEAFVKPNEAKAKVIMLENTEEMTVQSQNALLKILEEPPKGIYFILICENSKQMLTTILSRVYEITMEVPDIEVCTEELVRRFPDNDSAACKKAAIQSGGNIGKAIEFIQNPQWGEAFEKAEGTIESLISNKEIDALENLSEFERDKPRFLEQLTFMRAIVTDKASANSSKPSTALHLLRIIDIIDETILACEGNVNMLLLTTVFCSKVRTVLSQ